MRLTDLRPNWVGAGGVTTDMSGQPVSARRGVGVTFNCPCGCESRLYVPFSNPLDGGPAIEERWGWQRTGDTFETLTLAPSIHRAAAKGGCGWHGFVENGGVRTSIASGPLREPRPRGR